MAGKKAAGNTPETPPKGGDVFAGSSSFSFDDYPMVGETIGIWRLLNGLGRGGMGEVYEAEYDFIHVLTMNYAPQDRLAIVKELEGLERSELARMASDMLGTTLSDDGRFAIKVCTARKETAGYRRFLHEADWAKRLGSHPYIVSVHAMHGSDSSVDEQSQNFQIERGKHRDVAFMVMDLARRDYDHTSTSVTEAVHIVRCIATALDHAHSCGVVHRDLKPENILGDKNHPLLTDFGIAKEVDHSHGLTRTGQIIGTLDYMSPEQATDAKRVDYRSDVYSLGIVLFEFATKGGLPYYHLSEREVALAAIRTEKEESRWPRDFLPNFPRGLEYIILKAIAHRQEERYQGMSQFISDLDKFSRGERLFFWKRVHPRRFFSYFRNAHPKVMWGLPATVLAIVLVLGLTFVPSMLDKTRKRIDTNIAKLERAAKDIRDGRQGQLTTDQQKALQVLKRDVAAYAEDYPVAAQRYYGLHTDIKQHRRLRTDFSSMERYSQSLEELQYAITRGDRNWVMSLEPGKQGLHITADTEWTLKGYGRGSVYCWLRVRTKPGFQLRIVGDKERSPVTSCQVSEKGIHVSVQNESGDILLQDGQSGRITPERMVPLDIGLLVREGDIRAKWNRKDTGRRSIQALRESDSAQVSLFLPKGTVIEVIEIWPHGPSKWLKD